jgi:hypothetical protein
MWFKNWQIFAEVEMQDLIIIIISEYDLSVTEVCQKFWYWILLKMLLLSVHSMVNANNQTATRTTDRQTDKSS